MKKNKTAEFSSKSIWVTYAPYLVLAVILLIVLYKYVDPAPPDHMVISTSSDEGDYQTYAKLYQDILKDDRIKVELRPSSGAVENLERLKDPKSDVEVGFVQDGLGSPDDAPDLVSLGSLYYEPIWVFYRNHTELTRLSQLTGKKIAVGKQGGGTSILSEKLLLEAGIDQKTAQLVHIGWQEAADALKKDQIDVAFFLATPEDQLIKKLVTDSSIKLMSMDQAEAITRQIPFLHHLVLPHGAMDLKNSYPKQDTHLVSPTATLLVRDTLHPSLVYLLLKAAAQVHNEPGIFEKKDEFPIDKDYQFPLSDEAKHFYKSGPPFWQRYLPFWLATLLDRFIIVVVPLFVFVYPLIKLIPRFMQWRVRSRINRRYGELKFLETKILNDAEHSHTQEHLKWLDKIEDDVKRLKVPVDFSEHVYGLRGHIDFVRARLLQDASRARTP